MTQTLSAAPRREASPPRTATGPLVLAIGRGASGEVLRTGWALAPAFANHVHVLSVVETLPVAMLEGPPVLGAPGLEDSRTRERAVQLVATLRGVLGPDHGWEMEILHGYAARALTSRATALNARLLLVGIGRHRPIDRLLAAETALHVIRRASCPVLAVGAVLDHRPREVVVATDFSPHSAAAAEAVIPLLGSSATLHFAHVWERSAAPSAAMLAVEQRYEDSLPSRMARFVAALRIPVGVATTCEVREGKTVQRLLDIADDRHGDVIVAGRYGLNPVARLVLGSVTTSLLRGAGCGVFVTPEPSFRELDRMRRAMSGTSESHEPENWVEQLIDFTRRNQGRRTLLELDDPTFGAQTQETGFRLAGASYDPHDACVELMFGDPNAAAPHITRAIRGVDGVAILTDKRGRDLNLRVSHGSGQTLLGFLPDA